MAELASIIQRVLAGDVDAFGTLVLEYQVQVRAFLAARLDDPHEAEDLAQEVFLTAFKKIAEFDQSLPINPWLRGIAANLLRNHLRQRREQAAGKADEVAQFLESSLEQVDEHGQSLPALRLCLKALDGRARELFEGRYARGCTLAELSQQQQLKHSALTMALHRLRQRLRQCIDRRLGAREGAAS